MTEKLPYKIEQKKTLFDRVLRGLGISATSILITPEGILIAKSQTRKVLIPWQSIDCLDIEYLNPAKNSVLEQYQNEFGFFYLMCANQKLIQSCCIGRKVYLAATNVLAISWIEKSQVGEIFNLLTRLSLENKVTLGTIVIDH